MRCFAVAALGLVVAAATAKDDSDSSDSSDADSSSCDGRILSGRRRDWRVPPGGVEKQLPPRWDGLSASERREFTRCGAIPVDTGMFVDDSFGGEGSHYRYSRRDVDGDQAAARRDSGFVATALRKHVARGSSVLVVGSITPRREALCLDLGAARTTTVDYNRIDFEHPQTRTLTVDELADSDETFDLILADSSLDHDGLGRYGDPIAPDADLVAMDALRRRLGPGGKLLLSVPVGPDLLAFNLMRIYGPLRLPLLLEGFDVLDTIGHDEAILHRPVANHRRTHEPVFVLQATETEGGGNQSNDHPLEEQQRNDDAEL
mmetsp:Transcript_1107/g.3768  ORF Transcript_1107/g.3768 Transcript_1107/m.3768 type:complete len:318 (+) Transcript_1107:245-1198(+)